MHDHLIRLFGWLMRKTPDPVALTPLIVFTIADQLQGGGDNLRRLGFFEGRQIAFRALGASVSNC